MDVIVFHIISLINRWHSCLRKHSNTSIGHRRRGLTSNHAGKYGRVQILHYSSWRWIMSQSRVNWFHFYLLECSRRAPGLPLLWAELGRQSSQSLDELQVVQHLHHTGEVFYERWEMVTQWACVILNLEEESIEKCSMREVGRRSQGLCVRFRCIVWRAWLNSVQDN